MTIHPREKVQAALERALKLDPCHEKAVHAVAAALCLPVEAVQERGWRVMRRHFLGDRKPPLREAIRAARAARNGGAV